jgi:hypothetical protein
MPPTTAIAKTAMPTPMDFIAFRVFITPTSTEMNLVVHGEDTGQGLPPNYRRITVL